MRGVKGDVLIKRLAKALLIQARGQDLKIGPVACPVRRLTAGGPFCPFAAQPPVNLAAVTGGAAVEFIIQLAIDVAIITIADRAEPVQIEDGIGAVEGIIGPGHPVG